jgi:hypothetical protein
MALFQRWFLIFSIWMLTAITYIKRSQPEKIKFARRKFNFGCPVRMEDYGPPLSACIKVGISENLRNLRMEFSQI